MNAQALNINYSDPTIINLVIARLKTIPAGASLSIGNVGGTIANFKPGELIYEVENGTEIGRHVIDTQIFFIRSLQNLPKPEDVSPNN